MQATLELNDTYRLEAEYDLWLDLESVVGDSVGIYTLRMARGLRPIMQGELTPNLEQLSARLGGEQLERAVTLWLSLKNVNFQIVTLTGNSQGEWAEVVVYGDFDLAGAIEALRAYWSGEVYVVSLLSKQVYVHTENPNRTLEEWDTEDSLAGVVLKWDYTLEDFAKEYFPHLLTNN